MPTDPQIKRVIQGEAPGDLVLEEDLSTGGGSVPIRDGGLAYLESRGSGGPSNVSQSRSLRDDVDEVVQ